MYLHGLHYRIWSWIRLNPTRDEEQRFNAEEANMISQTFLLDTEKFTLLHNQRMNQYKIIKPILWFYRLTNNSTFFFSTLEFGFAGRVWPLSLPLQGSTGVTSFCWSRLSFCFSSPAEGGWGGGIGCWGWQGLCFGTESNCSGGTEAAPPCSPSFWHCCWRAFSRCNCFRLLFTVWGRCCCSKGSYKSINGREGETGLKPNLKIKDRLCELAFPGKQIGTKPT